MIARSSYRSNSFMKIHAFFFPYKANAYCYCACLDGKNQSICTSVYEFKNCPRMTCPKERYSYEPLPSQKLNPF